MTKRPPGHPPLDDDDDSVPIHVKMTTTQYDDTYRRARRARVSVPEQIRRDVREASEKRNPK